MARIVKGSQSFLHTHSFIQGTIHAWPSQPKMILICRLQRDERLSWPIAWGDELWSSALALFCHVQSCYLKFGSWTYDGFMLDISFYDDRAEVDTSDFVISNEWELTDHPGTRNVRYYACCGIQPYPDLTFMLRMRRLSAFYNYTIMLPCVLLSFLTAVIFWLPPESPAKLMLGWYRRVLRRNGVKQKSKLI